MPNEKPKIKIFPVKGMKINVSIIRIYIFVYVCTSSMVCFVIQK